MERRNVVGALPPALFTTGMGAFLASLNASTDRAFVYALRLFALFAIAMSISILVGLFLTARNLKKLAAAEAKRAEDFKLAILALAAEGGELQQRWAREDSDELQEATQEWGGRVVEYLEGLANGKVMAAYFVSENGYPFSQNYSQRVRPSKVSNWIVRRMWRLDNLMKGDF